MEINPKIYNLPVRTIIEKIDENTLALVVRRKSRIVMADGQKVLAKVSTIKGVDPAMRVLLQTTAPVCSKTKNFLKANGVEVIPL